MNCSIHYGEVATVYQQRTGRFRAGVRAMAAVVVGLAVVSVSPAQSPTGGSKATMRAKQFIERHVAKLRPLEKTANIAWWNANTSGKDEDFKAKEEAQNRIDEALADAATFAELKQIKQGERIDDLLVARQIDVLYLMYLEKQVDPELLKAMTAKANAVEKAFNVYRAQVDGKDLTENDVRRILKNSRSSDERRKAWLGSKGVGAVVEANLKQLVKLRNQAAHKLGFKNYHAMMLFLAEQDQDQIVGLFDELDELTGEQFRRTKAEVDARLAAHCGISVAELQPWHYHDPFFQECPSVFEANLDALYAKADILRLCRDFYAGIGLPIDDVLGRSDLYEKPGKSPHAFCTDIDREGDVRVLANIVPSERWMDTMLHELGHAVYSSKNIPGSVPYVLRSEAHILTTEGIAMLFGRLSKNGVWHERMGIAPADAAPREATARAGGRMLAAQLLIFSRWCQVMLRFEKGLYENPEQDLNRLWWDLVERYQMVRRPAGRSAPDYASKIHIVSAPVYYHNYLMGELFASQLHHAIVREVTRSANPRAEAYVGNRAVGEFIRQRVFIPGRTLPWNDLTKHATGSPLNAKSFAEDIHTK
jgi:peptidyl-dipeptidase A